MAVISGVLKGPMGDALEGVVIELRALRTSATVITQERSSSVTNASGRYSLTVEPGDYSVFISAFGRTPENRGSISVKVNSATGTLNDFLLIPGETDLNPAIVATVDGMRAAAAGSATAAKTSENNAAAAMTNALSKVDTAEQRVVGSVLFSRPTRLTSDAAGPIIPNSQGTWALWGRAAGRGSTDFVNHRGNGSGGYWFYDTDGATIKALAYLNGAGDLTVTGDLTVAGALTSTNGFNGKLITVTSDAEFYDWIKKADTRSQFFRNIGTGSTAAPAFSCGILSKVADSHMAIVGNYSTNVSQIIVTTGNTTTSRTHSLWTDKNTTVDANGFIKKASPIVKLFGTGESELNDQSQGVTTERVSEGVYRISGTLGFNADAEWGGVDGGIEIPTDRNKLPLVWVDYEVDETGDLLIKTFHRVNSTAPKFAQNVKVGYKEGQPIDIPAGRWIDLRVEMPGGDEPEYEPVPEDEVPEVTPEVTEPESGEEPAPGETPAPIEEAKE